MLRSMLVVLTASGAHAAGPDGADDETAVGANPVGRSAINMDRAGATSDDGFVRNVGAELVTFDSAATELLLAAGWQPRTDVDGQPFADHAERLRTFVAIAETLGLDPVVGAEQANWGTPQELAVLPLAESLGALQTTYAASETELGDLARHRADAETVLGEIRTSTAALSEGESAADTIAALEAEIASVNALIAEREQALQESRDKIETVEATIRAQVGDMLPPGDPKVAWLAINLDVTGDGVVDADDLQAALEREPELPAATE